MTRAFLLCALIVPVVCADIAGPTRPHRRVRKALPDDPLFSKQWHFQNRGENGARAGIDLHLTNTWQSYSGQGVVIAIVDDGIDTTHPDLQAHIDPSLGHDWNDDDDDPSAHPDLGDFHGTQCAGAAAAIGHNNQGIAGVAFGATLAGLRLISGDTTDEMEADALLFHHQEIDIKSNSWGPDDDGSNLEAPGPLTQAAIEESIRSGRGGKGTIFLFPAGNGLDAGDNANYDGFANSIYTIAVTSVSDQGFQTEYSEPGACIVVATPSGSFGRPGISTIDLQGAGGSNETGEPADYANLDYTSSFTGTSASVALAAGAVALVLEANPNLGWRDVQEILLRSASLVDEHDSDWSLNAAGLHFNHKFGAGLLNVDAAVGLALNWLNLAPQTNAFQSRSNLKLAIPDGNPSGATIDFDFTRTNIRIEHVTLTADINHPVRGHLSVTLISPSGMESRLAEQHADSNANYRNWTFMSVHHWGETSQGVWKIRIADLAPGNQGTLNSLRLDLYGTASGEPNPLLVESFRFSDAEGGNNNSGIEPGETISATVVLRNVGASSLTPRISLASRTPGVAVLDGEAPFPETPAGQQRESVPLKFQLSPSVPCQSTILFDLVSDFGSTRTTNSIRQLVGLPPAAWSLETVDSAGIVGSYTSLAVDSSGNSHVSYYDTTNGDLKYARQRNGQWTVETVDSAGDVGTYTSLALDSTGRPRISYRDGTARQLKFAAWNGNSWEIETVPTPDNAGNFSSLALDGSGAPRIAFMDESNRDLLYAEKIGGGWSVQRVDSENNTGSDISLALNSREEPVITYRDTTLNDLKLAVRAGGTWKIETIDSAGSVGYNTSTRIDANDQPVIAYRDNTNSDLKYAHRAADAWIIETVDSSGAVGFDASLALDSAGRPRISYRDISNNSLKYAAWNGAFWSVETVDTAGSVGSYSSIAIDGANRVHISYRDTSNGDLKFATLTSSECQIFQNKAASLAITTLAGEIFISWPATFQGGIEATSSLASPNWSPVPNSPRVQEDRYVIQLPADSTAKFFRLHSNR